VSDTDILTRPQPASPPGPEFGPMQWLRWGWRQLTSMRVALILLFLLAIASIPGSLFPQRGIDPVGVDQYIEDNPTTGPILDALSMFDVYASPWFAAIYLLLCVSLAGCIIPRTAEFVTALRRPPPPAPSRLDRLAGFRQENVTQDSAAVLTDAAAHLTSHRWRVRSGDGWVSAEKGYLREAGNLVFHLSLLALLAAVAVGSLWGWRSSVIVVEGRGFSNSVGQYDTFSAGALVDGSQLVPFTVDVSDFTAEFQRGGQQNGAPRDYRVDITYRSSPTSEPRNATIAVNSPLSIEGTKVFLTGHGYAPIVRVTDSNGQVAFDGPAVFLPQDGNLTSVGVVKAPDAQPQLGMQGIFLPTAAVDPQRGPISTFPSLDDPAIFLSAWKGDLGLDGGAPQSVFRLDVADMEQIGLESLRPGESWQLPDGSGSVQFVGVTEYVNIVVTHDPGRWWALAASIAAITGLMMSLFIPRRRVWVRTADAADGRTMVSMAGLARTDTADVGADTESLAQVINAKEAGA
jgi:cytochrome c biogenesis protein